jgi:hypothetical protein
MAQVKPDGADIGKVCFKPVARIMQGAGINTIGSIVPPSESTPKTD